MGFDLRTHTILLTVAGSRAHGLHRPDSDVDLKGVAVPSREALYGFLHPFEQIDDAPSLQPLAEFLQEPERAVVERSKLEGSVYDVRKFARLAADSNPNLFEILFCRDEEVRVCTAIGRRLRDARRIFLSQKARHSFSGYALAQLRRIHGHRRWLLDPPKGPPDRATFGLPPRTLIPADQLAAAQAAVRKKLDQWEIDFGALPKSEVLHVQEQIVAFLSEVMESTDARWKNAARTIGLDDNLILVLDRERHYKAAHDDWVQYQSWQKSRNPERAKLEAAFGYDTKHGAHIVRLLRMGREILETGEVHVWRGDRDAEELQAIRAGAWTIDRLLGWAEEEERALGRIVNDGKAVVRERPDMEAIDALAIELVEASLA